MNPQYAQIEIAEGRQSTVSARDLAPPGNTSEEATVMKNCEYPVFRTSPVKLGDQILRTSSSDTLPNESDYPYEPSLTSNSEERPIPQKRPQPTSETDTYFQTSSNWNIKKRWHFKARPSMQKCVNHDNNNLSSDVDGHQLPEQSRCSQRTRKMPGRWKDFDQYE